MRVLMFGSSYKIATIWGIPIKIHMSLIILLLIFAITMAFSGGLNAILIVLFLELCIFISIALHELGHSFVAIRKGCRVREITLMFIGGAAQMENIPTRPKDEFLMAVAGPAVSIFLGLLLIKGGDYLPLRAAYWPVPLVRNLAIRCNIVQFLGIINLALAAFNLLPSFPMDGGRVFRALLTPRLGRLRATFIAARLGKIMAVFFGIYGFLAHYWLLVLIAFFIYTAAGNEYRLVQIQEAVKQHGFGFIPPFGNRWDSHNDNDKVIIGPPPYEDGPGSQSDIHSSEELYDET